MRIILPCSTHTRPKLHPPTPFLVTLFILMTYITIHVQQNTCNTKWYTTYNDFQHWTLRYCTNSTYYLELLITLKRQNHTKQGLWGSPLDPTCPPPCHLSARCTWALCSPAGLWPPHMWRWQTPHSLFGHLLAGSWSGSFLEQGRGRSMFVFHSLNLHHS